MKLRGLKLRWCLRAGAAATSIALAVKRSLLLCSLSLFAACSNEAEADVNANKADANKAAANKSADNESDDNGSADNGADGSGKSAPYDDSDCNLQTVLKPGIPGSPGNLIKSERNPNGDSELAVLMRLFVDGLRDTRVLVEAGEKIQPLHPLHRGMRCAWPTVPSERDEGFDGRAQSYLSVVRSFDAAPSKETYNAIVSSCVACHEQSCSGVIEFIQTLRWE